MEAAMLTPQAIKDQEFQIKFRGYDAIEVKSYLELLAEDFFELLEQSRVHIEEIESFVAEQELYQVEKEKIENELRNNQVSRDEIEADIQKEYSRKDEEIEDLKTQISKLETTVSGLEDENSKYCEKILELEENLSSGSDAIVKEQNEVERLQYEFERVEERKKELEKEGLDFKTTLFAAQKFADNLKESSEQDALATITAAKAEVQKLRNEAHEELAYLPKEIEQLQQKKIQVRCELKAILDKAMVGLDDAFSESDADAREDDLSDLFQRIQIPDGENMDQEDTTGNTESS
jgi:DivIVA domain-containing protein